MTRARRRVYVICEGQTEEAVAKQTLATHLDSHGIDLIPWIVKTKRVAGGGAHRGGGRWQHYEREIQPALRDSTVACVTTMIDLYGCPSDTPGWGRSASLVGRDRAVAIEAAITASIKDSRLLPYLQVHEVEALLFVDPVLVGERSGIDKVATELTKAVAAAGDPELVNDGAATHPSMRLVAAWPQFAKTSDVPTLIAAIGLVAIRNTCPHFDTWLTKLETI